MCWREWKVGFDFVVRFRKCCEAGWLMDERSAWLMGITERERQRARSVMGAAYRAAASVSS
ncbi:hypothetical protein, partial [Myxococcus eversor]|uniref:hypothetical protein n=1 Tax=Myxococcus eversor TaxID=2709661 RepID=UPI0013D096B3